MNNNKSNESSSSEDETCTEALREAADQDFLKNSLFNKTDKTLECANEKNVDKKTELENLQEYENYGLSQSCRDFIAKKLNERLNIDILIEDKKEKKRNKIKNKKIDSDNLSGIKLFNTSNVTITTFEEEIESEKEFKRKKIGRPYDEKTNLSKCKEVAVDPEIILTQKETKYWTDRKVSKLFRYKKLKNGTLLEIKQTK